MADNLTKEQLKDRIAALLREREGYVRMGQTTADVDKELDRLGHEGKAPAKRATQLKRSSGKKD